MDPLDRMYLDTVLSADSIREHIDDYTLFCYYLDDEPIINVPVHSPLRTDPRPSFALYYDKNGNLRWSDHGTGQGGDVFQFLRDRYGLSFRDALRQVNKDFGLGYEGHPSVEVTVERKKPLVRPKRKLEITSRDFTKKALDWWGSYYITPETLKRYNVTQVDWMHWDKNPVKASEMTFAYRIWKYYKIYRPMFPSGKFLNNYPRNYVEGLLQLPKEKKLLIITKSLKDVMTLSVLGFEAVSPKSESTVITQGIRDYLNQFYDRIVVMFDDDEGGRAGSEKYPEYQKVFLEKVDEKDISDFTRNHGPSRARELLQELLYT